MSLNGRLISRSKYNYIVLKKGRDTPCSCAGLPSQSSQPGAAFLDPSACSSPHCAVHHGLVTTPTTTIGSASSRLGKHVIGFPCPFYVSISRRKSFRYALLHHSRGYTAGAYATHICFTCPGGSLIEVLVCFLMQLFFGFSFLFSHFRDA